MIRICMLKLWGPESSKISIDGYRPINERLKIRKNGFVRLSCEWLSVKILQSHPCKNDCFHWKINFGKLPIWCHASINCTCLQLILNPQIKLTRFNKTLVGQLFHQGLYSLSGKTSYCKVSWSLEAARSGVRLFRSLWNLTRWRHQMETFSALLAICEGNSPVPGEFLAQRPVTPGFHVFLDLRLNKRLSKQSWCWWFESISRPLWRQCNDSHLGSSANEVPVQF